PMDPDRALLRPLRIGRWAAPVIVAAVPVGAPLPDVAVHVMQAQRVGVVDADLAGVAEMVAEVGPPGGDAVAEREPRVLSVATTPAGVLPLRLGRQAVEPMLLRLVVQFGQLRQELLGVVPRDLLDGEVVGVQALDLLGPAPGGGEPRGV